LKHYVEIEESTKAAALQSLPRKIKKAKCQNMELATTLRSSSPTKQLGRVSESTHKVPMKTRTFKNVKEFARHMERATGKPFKAAASTDGTSAHKYLSGQRHWSTLFTDSDLIAIVNDKHPDGGLLYVFSDYSSVVYKSSATN
jgi:hypothetical protein